MKLSEVSGVEELFEGWRDFVANTFGGVKIDPNNNPYTSQLNRSSPRKSVPRSVPLRPSKRSALRPSVYTPPVVSTPPVVDHDTDDVKSALSSLGYTLPEIATVIDNLTPGKTVAEKIREAISLLSVTA